MLEIRWQRAALQKLRQTQAYLLEHSPAAARRLRGLMTLAFLRLLRHPDIGAQIRECPGSPARQIIVGDYRVFFWVDRPRKTLWILDLWHGAQLARSPELPADPR